MRRMVETERTCLLVHRRNPRYPFVSCDEHPQVETGKEGDPSGALCANARTLKCEESLSRVSKEFEWMMMVEVKEHDPR